VTGNNVSLVGGGVHIGGTVTAGANVSIIGGAANINSAAVTGMDVSVLAGALNLTNASISASNTVTLGLPSLLMASLTMDNSYIYATHTVDFAAFNAALNNTSIIGSGNGHITGIVGKELRINNGSGIYAGDDVRLRFLRHDAMLYLNDTAGGPSSKIASDSVAPLGTTYISFRDRATGGIVIDGVATSATLAGGSGFYWGDPLQLALPGSGLEVSYSAGALDPAVQDILTRKLDLDPLVWLPPTGSGGREVGDQNIGGGDGEFGDGGGQNRGRRPVKQCRG
jgi:hypothetical protein